jgi:hypothetical protein
MPALVLPAARKVRKILGTVSSGNPAIGIIDARTGKVYLSAASDLDGGDHATLIKEALRIYDRERAMHVRGFVVVPEQGQWHVLNVSGLNPLDNQMEAELFEELESMLMPLLGDCPLE